MNEKPAIPLNTGHENHRRQLLQWLAEWRADQLLSHDEAPFPAQQESASGAPAEQPRAGGIFLLQPLSPALAERPRYAALLDLPSNGRALAAPFSRFSIPATPGEFHLGGESLPTRVLCVWNARWVSWERLPPGWNAGALTEEERLQALALCATLEAGAPPPPSLSERTGPPLTHPLDPRWTYIEEELEWADHGLPGKRIRHPNGAASLYERTSGADKPLPLAAESRPDYRAPHKKPQ